MNEAQYDFIVDTSSILKLNSSSEGWPVIINNKDLYQKSKNETMNTLGIFGGFNHGKSFLLERISNFKFPSGYSLSTKGGSLRYKFENNEKRVFLDTSGMKTPVLVDKTMPIQELCRDKILSEMFIQDFVGEYSNCGLVVINQLSYSEQQLLKNVKKKTTAATIIVIHNLFSLPGVKDIKHYIETVGLKSLTFKLQKLEYYFDFDINNPKTDDSRNKIYYEEIIESISDEKRRIIHIIMGNENYPEIKKYYNDTALEILRGFLSTDYNRRKFNVLECLKNYLSKFSFDAFAQEISEDDIEISDKLIRLKNKKKIIFKDFYLDEESSYCFLKPNDIPNYSWEINSNKDKGTISIELSGSERKVIPQIQEVGLYYIIQFKGTYEADNVKEEWGQKRESKPENFVLNIKFPKYLGLDFNLSKPIIWSKKNVIFVLYET